MELVAEKKAGISPRTRDDGMDSGHTMSLLCHREHQPFPLHLPLGDTELPQMAAELLLQLGKTREWVRNGQSW